MHHHQSSAFTVEWLDGGSDHGNGLDHWEGPEIVDLAEGGHGCVEKLQAG